MIGEQMYLNEEDKILKETDHYIIIKPLYSPYPQDQKPLVYKKNTIFYLSRLPRLNWNEAIYDGCCISVWIRSGARIDSGKRWDLTLAVSHNGIKTVKIISPIDTNDLPIKIKNELLKVKI